MGMFVECENERKLRMQGIIVIEVGWMSEGCLLFEGYLSSVSKVQVLSCPVQYSQKEKGKRGQVQILNVKQTKKIKSILILGLQSEKSTSQNHISTTIYSTTRSSSKHSLQNLSVQTLS